MYRHGKVQCAGQAGEHRGTCRHSAHIDIGTPAREHRLNWNHLYTMNISDQINFFVF